MKKRIYQELYQILSYLSNRFNNRYLTKYKVLLGTSLLILMNISQSCKRGGRVTCYEPSALPDDTVEVQAQQDSIEVMCYEVPEDLTDEVDTDTSTHTSVKQLIVPEPQNEDVTMSIETTDNEIEDDIMCYVIVLPCPDVMPKFPGGDAALMSYISKNARYPKEAIEKDITGQVSVQFVIMQDGSIDSVQVARSSDPIFNEEALRVIREMPKWTPATCKGKPVEAGIKYTVPVRFRLPR